MSTISASDSNIKYSPYNWNVDSNGAKTICSGAYCFIEFTGTITTLSALFNISNLSSPLPKVGFRVDGGAWQDYTIASTINLTVPTSNTWGKHTVEMVVISTSEAANRWNSPYNTAVIFTGITADTTISSIATNRNKTLYGLAFGDSITEGVRTLNMTATNDTDRNDSRLTWAYPLSSILGAELGVVGFGGTGINKVGSGNIPRFCDSIPYLYSGQARDFSSPKYPDFIVGNIGTNDGGTSDADALTYTLSLINYLLANTPNSTKIFIYAGWLQTKSTQIKQACLTCNNPARVVFIDTTGWWSTSDSSDSLHPYGYVNISSLSYKIAEVIRQNFTNYYIKSSTGKAVPLIYTK